MLKDQVNQLRERALGRLNPKQKQWALLGSFVAGFGGFMWLMFTINDNSPARPTTSGDPLGIAGKPIPSPIMAAGAQVRPADAWIANAGKEVEQLKADREEARRRIEGQERANKDMMVRFDELQRRLSAAPPAAPPMPAPLPPPPVAAASAAAAKPVSLPPLPPPPRRMAGDNTGGLPFGEPGAGFMPPAPGASLVRVSLSDGMAAAVPAAAAAAAQAQQGKAAEGGEGRARSLETYLPISFTKAVLLGGLDAPTGGQSQNNPHPVLLRLEDNAMLPNRFRGQVRECFVVGAGYGDLSSERAYIRTERLSCVRSDGTAVEMKIKGSIFGEDGKVGVRGRLISKQGQVLANALIAGVVSGIGSGIEGRYTNTSSSALGTVSSVEQGREFQAGMGQGVGKAMDRLAQYYITLAEKMFPIIEVDAGRLVDVVLTEGVTLDAPLTAETQAPRSSTNSYRGQAARMRTTGASDED